MPSGWTLSPSSLHLCEKSYLLFCADHISSSPLFIPTVVFSPCSGVCSHSTHYLRDASTGLLLPVFAGRPHDSVDILLKSKYPLGAIFPIDVTLSSLFSNFVYTSLLCGLLLREGGSHRSVGGPLVMQFFQHYWSSQHLQKLQASCSLTCLTSFSLIAILTGVLSSLALPQCILYVCMRLNFTVNMLKKFIPMRLFWTKWSREHGLLAKCYITQHTSIHKPQLHPS